jgi:hypothetical protein
VYYYLELGEHPKLWLNSDFESLQELLHVEGTVGRHARLRDALFDRIAHAVWTQLFIDALTAAGDSGDPTFEWQAAALRAFVPSLQPGQDVADGASALYRRMQEEPVVFFQDLDRFLQFKHREGSRWAALVEEVQTTG